MTEWVVAPCAHAGYPTLSRQFWQCDNKAQAECFLPDWCARAESEGIKHLKRFAQSIVGHRTGLLACYDDPISTGPLEGTNNKIKSTK